MEQDRLKVRQLYQQMSFPEKCKYLWTEFRWHFLAVVIAVAVLISMAVHFLNKEEPVLWGATINLSLTPAETYVQQWEAALELDAGNCISFDNGVLIKLEDLNNSQSLSYASAYRIICAVAAQELDFVITDKNGLMFLYNEEICRDVRDILEESLLKVYEPYLYTPEELEIPIALDLSGTPMAQMLGLTEEEVYLALPNLSGNNALLQDLLKYIYDYAIKKS